MHDDRMPAGARWSAMLAALCRLPLPPPPDVPGRVFVCADEPLADDDLEQITSTAELALVLGISRQAAWRRLKRRKEATSDCPA